jgi:hypothetical protein
LLRKRLPADEIVVRRLTWPGGCILKGTGLAFEKLDGFALVPKRLFEGVSGFKPAVFLALQATASEFDRRGVSNCRRIVGLANRIPRRP